MARNKSESESDTSVEAVGAEESFEVSVATGEMRPRQHTREAKPNPLQKIADNAYETGRLLDVKADSPERAKYIESLVRRAAAFHDRSSKVQYFADEGVVRFQITDRKTRPRKYTSAEIRQWAEENGLPSVGAGKGSAIPADTRRAFKEARGYA